MVGQKSILKPHVVEWRNLDVILEEETEIVIGCWVPALAHRSDETSLDDAPAHVFGPMRPLEIIDYTQRVGVYPAIHVEGDVDDVSNVMRSLQRSQQPQKRSRSVLCDDINPDPHFVPNCRGTQIATDKVKIFRRNHVEGNWTGSGIAFRNR